MKLLYAGSQNLGIGNPYSAPLHVNPGVTELLLICKGEGTYQSDGKLYEAGPQSVVFFNQDLWHDERSHGDKPYVTLYLGFSGMQFAGLPQGHFMERSLSPVIPINDHFFKIEQRLREILNANQTGDPETAWIVGHLLAVLIGELVSIYYHKNKADPSPVRIADTVKRFIHENYSSNIDLADLAQVVSLSTFHLCHMFSKETGLSPIQYLIRYRMEAAKQYLLSTNSTMEHIAELVGYRSEAHFQHAFKKWIGIPPGKYRSGIKAVDN